MKYITGSCLVLCIVFYAIASFASTIQRKADKTENIQIEVTGGAAQTFFRLRNETIYKIAHEEILALIANQEDIVKVKAALHIKYKWEYVRFIPFWLLCPIGAPAGRHIGEVNVSMTISNPDPLKYEGSAKLKKLQGLWYGWKYDLPFGGGIIKYAIRDAIQRIKVCDTGQTGGKL